MVPYCTIWYHIAYCTIWCVCVLIRPRPSFDPAAESIKPLQAPASPCKPPQAPASRPLRAPASSCKLLQALGLWVQAQACGGKCVRRVEQEPTRPGVLVHPTVLSHHPYKHAHGALRVLPEASSGASSPRGPGARTRPAVPEQAGARQGLRLRS